MSKPAPIGDLFNTLQLGCVFSSCRKYRYTLERVWDGTLPAIAFIGLNPSTADERLDDPTIRRCIGFAKQWGYGRYFMLNLFAYRATLPIDMKAQPEPIGADNDQWIIDITKRVNLVIAAWGKDGRYLRRDSGVLSLLQKQRVEVYHLGLNNDGTPKHPLYLAKTRMPERLNFD